MWYGLKQDGELVAVAKFDHSPAVSEFSVRRITGATYLVVVVRIREVGTADVF